MTCPGRDKNLSGHTSVGSWRSLAMTLLSANTEAPPSSAVALYLNIHGGGRVSLGVWADLRLQV